MRIQFYKAQPNGKGHACSLKTTDKNELMLEIIKQDSWDAATKTGSFKANSKNIDKKAVIKFSHTEAAGMLMALENAEEFKFFHNYKGVTTSGGLKYSEFTAANSTVVSKRYSLQVKDSRKSDPNFNMSFLRAEARQIHIFLSEYLAEVIKNDAYKADETPVAV